MHYQISHDYLDLTRSEETSRAGVPTIAKGHVVQVTRSILHVRRIKFEVIPKFDEPEPIEDFWILVEVRIH